MKSIKSFFEKNSQWQKAFFLGMAVLCLTPLVSAPLALVAGFVIAEVTGNPYEEWAKKITSRLLQYAVVGLGFGMNVNSALKAGKEGFLFTVFSITMVLFLGFVLTRWLKIDKILGYLIASGTAICGGSAIAAVSPVVKAKPGQITVALAVVFLLNSLALLIFPVIGHMLQLSQQQFGLWSAIAIHDTSSVVGAASKYGAEALEVATTVKLARALWIIPLSFFSVWLFKNKESKVKIPNFIGFFVLAMCLNTYVPALHTLTPVMVAVSKALLTLTLFLIGAGLSVQTIKSVGSKPLFLAVLLWVVISAVSLFVIITNS